MYYVESFDGFHCVPAPISKACIIRLDTNKYSVLSTAVGRPVDVEGSRRKQCASVAGMLAASEVAHILNNRVYLCFSSSPNLRETGCIRPVREIEALQSIGDHKFTPLRKSLSLYLCNFQAIGVFSYSRKKQAKFPKISILRSDYWDRKKKYTTS
ncbi:Mu transposase domain-containing protein [Shinella sp. M31]|uniref:Mu transposase domain-containing protein n=1 Tax=Shinella sp. M31 TaxID=3368615 RepID=UPI003B9F3CF9